MKRPSLANTRRAVVLLVQPSHDDSLEMYVQFLRYHGLAVIPVSDARDALMLAPQVDIVVTGMNLDNQMDGVELVSRLRHNDCTRFTPIVVLTACAWPKDRERAEGAGCDVFLPNPCLPNDLLGEVRQLLAATRPQAADTPHAFSILHTAQRLMRRDPMPLTGCLAQWQGHRDGDINERKAALYGPPCCRPFVTQVGGAQSVDDWLQAERELRRGASMNRDELEGKSEALKGKIKHAAGAFTRDPDLHDEGVIDEVAGKTQAAVGRSKRKVGEAIEHVGNFVKK
jgi:CheY-like chemotaxis protein/uncharacterized protein YjbJ (UPF0337 family)